MIKDKHKLCSLFRRNHPPIIVISLTVHQCVHMHIYCLRVNVADCFKYLYIYCKNIINPCKLIIEVDLPILRPTRTFKSTTLILNCTTSTATAILKCNE